VYFGAPTDGLLRGVSTVLVLGGQDVLRYVNGWCTGEDCICVDMPRHVGSVDSARARVAMAPLRVEARRIQSVVPSLVTHRLALAG